ncbi:MAG: response regulator [Ginsengibacter sp.]
MNKILVVDDDKEILNVIKVLLTANQYVVKTIRKWQSILNTIKTFMPDLILLDIDLRGADGGDICRKLKHSKKTQQVPVILFSALMPEEYLKESNAQGFLPKPFEQSDLLTIIRHNLN